MPTTITELNGKMGTLDLYLREQPKREEACSEKIATIRDHAANEDLRISEAEDELSTYLFSAKEDMVNILAEYSDKLPAEIVDQTNTLITAHQTKITELEPPPE